MILITQVFILLHLCVIGFDLHNACDIASGKMALVVFTISVA